MLLDSPGVYMDKRQFRAVRHFSPVYTITTNGIHLNRHEPEKLFFCAFGSTIQQQIPFPFIARHRRRELEFFPGFFITLQFE